MADDAPAVEDGLHVAPERHPVCGGQQRLVESVRVGRAEALVQRILRQACAAGEAGDDEGEGPEAHGRHPVAVVKKKLPEAPRGAGRGLAAVPEFRRR